MDVQSCRNTFIQLCMTLERYQYRFDSRYIVKKYNAVFGEIWNLCKQMFLEDPVFAEQVLVPLMEHSHKTVRIQAAVYCLYGRLQTDTALALLQQIAEDETENKFCRFEMQMTIREYLAGNLHI